MGHQISLFSLCVVVVVCCRSLQRHTVESSCCFVLFL
jgi:hypothetical protein